MDDTENKLTKRERRILKKRLKKEKRKHENRRKKVKKLTTIAVWVLVIGGAIFGLGRYYSGRPSLPPTAAQGHTEGVPAAHVIDTPISDSIQRHMIEHADGRGRPGVLIQYNCDNFDCESDFLPKLTELVGEFPDNVYLAPNNYDGKIILTRLGKREILEEFDESIIRVFITAF